MTAWQRAIDWDAVTHEATELLSGFIACESVNPPGNEAVAAGFLTRVLEREGFAVTRYDPGGGRVSISARLEGDGSAGKPLLLLSHTDVVPVQREYWTADPFSGEVRDGYLWGRGALDMKGLGIVELMALLLCKRLGLPLKRDLVYLAVADEEAGSAWGVEWLDRHHPEALEAAWVINEGAIGYSRLFGWERPVFTYSPAEKTPLWLELGTRGPAGHGSIPLANSAPERLVRALHRIATWERPPRVIPVVEELFAGLTRAGLLTTMPTPREMVEFTRQSPAFYAMVTDTVSITTATSGFKVNVIPSEAAATLDCRLLPDRPPAAFLEELRAVIDDPEVELTEMLNSPSGLSDTSGEMVRAMEAAVRQEREDALLVPLICPGFTDSRVFRRRGIPAYGFMPFLVTLEEEATIHGHDERISIDNLRLGTQVLFRIIRDVCS